MTGNLIVALDVDTRRQAERLVERLDGAADFFKIGYQLFYGGDGLALGRELAAAKKRVFFDLKLLDIDNTVEKGAGAIAGTGATFLTVHAYPGALRAARRATEGSDLGILGVTVLTSMDEADLREAGYDSDIPSLVSLRVQEAREIGVAGIVCSPREAQLARSVAGPKLAIVTPGVRPAGSEAGDQKRMMTPTMALEAGATHLVVGRPITAAQDPGEAARRILDEMAGRAG